MTTQKKSTYRSEPELFVVAAAAADNSETNVFSYKLLIFLYFRYLWRSYHNNKQKKKTLTCLRRLHLCLNTTEEKKMDLVLAHTSQAGILCKCFLILISALSSSTVIQYCLLFKMLKRFVHNLNPPPTILGNLNQ